MSEATPACPKCEIGMETLERNGVTIERCERCEGVFLDRGELERLIDAESAYLAELAPEDNPDTTYQGRHRRGVLQQIFGPEEQAKV
jgi:Zn-finger nucleic acid-binding protein